MKLLKVLIPMFVIMTNSHAENKQPTVLVSILVRNKAHTLPYFLSNFESLNYPKDRMALCKRVLSSKGKGKDSESYDTFDTTGIISGAVLPNKTRSVIYPWIRSDHNEDNSLEILRQWISSVKNKYHSIDTEFVEDGKQYPSEYGPAHWTSERFKHIINLRESALHFAKKIWADYLLTIDCDVFLINPDTLNYLVSKNYTVVAPMLRSEGLYSNFWYGMTEDYYYQRTEEYTPVLHRENLGCFAVPMVHTCVLIDLRRKESEYLTYVPERVENFDGPNDDIITFAISANRSDISLNICNEMKFGFLMVPLEQNDQLKLDYDQMTNIKLEVLNSMTTLYVNDLLKKFVRELPRKDTLGFDKIFMINLLRRPERRKRMNVCFDELGIQVDILDAVDGQALNESFLEALKFMPEFSDPYHKRPMKLGEIGCFMSHLNIWKKIVTENYQTTLVLEDDIRFESFFRHKVQNVMAEVRRIPDWDLVYFGRKRLEENEEPWVEGTNFLVHAGYSYWTLGYALSLRGAKKLLAGDPLTRLVPVDEYLPILFDKHPQESWKGHYPRRDLVAFSAAPLLIYPTHYTGEKGYISDTEDSVIIPEILRSTREDL